MSFEFSASERLCDECVSALRLALGSSKEYELVENTPARLAVRFCDDAAPTAWNEDVEIHLGDVTLVVFHRATGDQRAALLELVQRTAAGCGQQIVFDET